MHIDTAEYQIIRGELAGLGAAVEELARRQRDDRNKAEHDLGRLRGTVADLAIRLFGTLEAALGRAAEPQLLAVDGGHGQRSKPRRGHLQLVGQETEAAR